MRALPIALPIEEVTDCRSTWSGVVGGPFRPTTVMVKGDLR